MTQQFILDENVVILAQKGENERGDRDPTCGLLIARIIRICHTIVMDSVLRQKYLRQLSHLQESQVGLPVLREFAVALQTGGKVNMHPAASRFPEEGDIPAGSRDDVEIVRLAVQTGATLVTTDEALRVDLNSSGVAETYNLRLSTPAESLRFL